MLRPQAADRGVTLETCGEDKEVWIHGDRERLRQVLINLIQNAVEAVDEGGRVEVGAAADGAGARIVVQDDGPGIPEEYLPRIFEPFFSTKPSGTGLGMAITHSLVSLHGGDVQVTCDGGTRVEVTLPPEPPAAIPVDTRPPMLRLGR